MWDQNTYCCKDLKKNVEVKKSNTEREKREVEREKKWQNAYGIRAGREQTCPTASIIVFRKYQL